MECKHGRYKSISLSAKPLEEFFGCEKKTNNIKSTFLFMLLVFFHIFFLSWNVIRLNIRSFNTNYFKVRFLFLNNSSPFSCFSLNYLVWGEKRKRTVLWGAASQGQNYAQVKSAFWILDTRRKFQTLKKLHRNIYVNDYRPLSYDFKTKTSSIIHKL